MTEPIMIDGIDVSECEYFCVKELGYCEIGLWANNGAHICECEHNCHFKEWKRKERECELKTKQLEVAREALQYYLDNYHNQDISVPRKISEALQSIEEMGSENER